MWSWNLNGWEGLTNHMKMIDFVEIPLGTLNASGVTDHEEVSVPWSMAEDRGAIHLVV
jgi:hypothetical protein